jgi:hypothetical protein
MSARGKAIGILGPGKFRQLEEAGLMVVEGSERWEVEFHTGGWHECPTPAPRFYATRTPGATGRIRPLYAGDAIDVTREDT